MGTREVGSKRTCVSHAAHQIKQQKLAVAQNVLDVVAENPQEPHVAEHVQPAGMQKHGSENVGYREMVRYQTVGGNESIASIRVERELEQENQNVDHDQQDRDHGLGIARLCVA
jgi:hypothetical protein